MESESKKRKLNEEEENSHNDLCMENQTPKSSLSQIRECIMKNWDEIDKDVQDLLLNCCRKVCQALEENEKQESASGKCSINSLPDEVIVMILKYLDYPNFCRIKRVCRRWYTITTSNRFFKKLDLDIRREKNNPKGIPEILFEQLSIISARVTHLNLNFDRRIQFSLNFCDFSKKMRECCPNLNTLILNRISFDVCGENLDIGLQMPKNTRVLVLKYVKFLKNQRLEDVDCDIPKISILDLSHCKPLHIHPSSFLLLRHLKVLRLAGCETTNWLNSVYTFEPTFSDLEVPPNTYPEDYFYATVVRVLCNQLKILDLERTFMNLSTLRVIRTRCVLLTELFICFTMIDDAQLRFPVPETTLPNLKILCLRNCAVTIGGVAPFIRECPSLEHVYVGHKDDHPADGFSDCQIPQICLRTGYKHCNHNEEVNYMSDEFVE